MKLLNAKTIAALAFTAAVSIGTASAGDSGDALRDNDTASESADNFVDVRAAVASHFTRNTSSAGRFSASRSAQQDLLNKSAQLAANNL